MLSPHLLYFKINVSKNGEILMMNYLSIFLQSFLFFCKNLFSYSKSGACNLAYVHVKHKSEILAYSQSWQFGFINFNFCVFDNVLFLIRYYYVHILIQIDCYCLINGDQPLSFSFSFLVKCDHISLLHDQRYFFVNSRAKKKSIFSQQTQSYQMTHVIIMMSYFFKIKRIEKQHQLNKTQLDNSNIIVMDINNDAQPSSLIVQSLIQGQLQRQQESSQNQNQNPPAQIENQIPSIFLKIIQLMHLPTTKTLNCKHKLCCIESILRDSAKITAVSYLVKSGMSSVFGIKRIFTNPINFIKILASKDSINFGLFVGSFVLLFRSVLCIARRYLSQNFHRYIPLIAGLFGGLVSILFLQKKSRQTFALFLFARAIDITYNNLVKKGYLPEFKYFYVVLYSLMMGITGYVYGTEPGSMSPQMNKFYLTFTNQTLADMQMRQIWIQRKNNYLAQRGIPRQDPLQYIPKLKKYYQSLKTAK